MILDCLQFLARQSSVNIVGRLLNGQMRSTLRRGARLRRLAEYFGLQRKKSRPTFQRSFDLPAACAANVQVIRGKQQFACGERTVTVTLYLCFGKMFRQFFLLYSPESDCILAYISRQNAPDITARLK